MITSITLPVVIVALIGCCFTQTIKVPDGKCKGDSPDNTNWLNYPTFGSCKVRRARYTPGRSCEMEVKCSTRNMEVCPKDAKVDEFTKWEVDFVDASNNYVCITRQYKSSPWCSTYFVCFYDQIDDNQNWDCVFAMKVNRYQLSTENSFDFETIEIKISKNGNLETKREKMETKRFCKQTTIFALATPNRDNISVISYLDHEEINWAEDFTDSALINALVKNLNVTQK